ncbi:CRISPR-associated protein Cas5 [Paraburkholderia panacisoli]|uniref:CRISPR-associated protein Cas5 n=1 Tax=Paraburkholderia panacisoli TaxID=2603818 RepID=A0A5B0GJF7_9BURK|nr:CRISPR-associated protein Cas5 [Paraburkholderia panacisoli]
MRRSQTRRRAPRQPVRGRRDVAVRLRAHPTADWGIPLSEQLKPSSPVPPQFQRSAETIITLGITDSP